MVRKIESLILLLTLLCPAVLPAQQGTYDGPSSNPPAAPAQSSPPRHVRSETVRRRSYQRETNSRRRHRISKGEIAFMAAIAGTSMGIGALAGGAKGLAVGAIVGGWGAYAGHRLWKWIK
jgi:hypothetical protein